MKRSEMALIVNESEDVVFEEREYSLDLLHTFRSSEKYEKNSLSFFTFILPLFALVLMLSPKRFRGQVPKTNKPTTPKRTSS